MTKTIPTFAADGTRLRNRTVTSVEALLSQGKIAIERNRLGRIVCATFLPAPTSAPTPRTKVGQTYSYAQPLPSGHKAWKFSALISPEDMEDLAADGVTPEEADAYVRSVFLQVSASCQAFSDPVLRHLPKRPQRRPIEFDSERAAA